MNKPNVVAKTARRGRPAGSKNRLKGVDTSKVDWRALSKKLEEALTAQFFEEANLRNEIKDLEFKIINLEHQAIGYQAVVSYLESKVGND